MDDNTCIHMKPNIQYQHNTQRVSCQAETGFIQAEWLSFLSEQVV